MDDAATYQLLKACETTAVFQRESRGMKDLVRRLQPDRLEDIVATVALFRPGPLQSGMVHDLHPRMPGRIYRPIATLHPPPQNFPWALWIYLLLGKGARRSFAKESQAERIIRLRRVSAL